MFFYITLMRREKKVRTQFFCPPRPSMFVARRRHFSIVLNIKEDSLQVAKQVIDDLLMAAFQEELRKESFTRHVNTLMGKFEALGDSYQLLKLNDSQSEVYNQCDSQPLPQNMKTLQVVPPGHIKKLVRVPAGPPCTPTSPTEEQLVQHEQQRKQKQSLIHKLKRQHSTTVKTKYLSESLPILDKNDQVCPETDHMVELMRRNIAKQMLPKRSSKQIKMWRDEEAGNRKENKMVTVFKKSKAFIDRIDPTNSMYNKTVVSKDESRQRMSFYLDSRVTPMEESILARVTNLSEITNLVQPSKEKVIERKVSKEAVRLPRLSEGRKQIKNRIEHVSLHASGRANLKQIDASSQRIRPKNSLSVAQLPKIKKV